MIAPTLTQRTTHPRGDRVGAACAYKVLDSADMAGFHARRVFAGSAADLADGFIHLSVAAQLTGTVDKHFAGQADLFVVAVDLAVIADGLRWEPARGGVLFPHLYGPLPWAAVIAFEPMRRETDGTVSLPR